MTKEDLKLQLLAAPSFLLIGIGLFILWGSNPGDVHPALANPSIAYGLFVLSGMGALLSLVKGLRIFMARR
ncbi:hypothetical protein J7J49_07430 [Halomonas sp. ISL-56]|uniref:hypothetical protein n=1 Tax=Halomonas sp. ISL-56 TaxID=2819149 RepID=UPI001BEA3BEA|nr:hypothetical protein [Halomonas sp. ISL-56]MBT2801151.1 hypothetical protein [Halomonas sp. ISL-56]